jgi:gliding motility-associated-like protein
MPDLRPLFQILSSVKPTQLMRRLSIIFLFTVSFQFAFGTIYHVTLSGNDNTGDGSLGNPWRSLRAAVSKVPAGQGHTIKLSGGTFVEGGSFNVPIGVNIEGSGVDQTIIKAASSFYFNPTSPGFALDKFLMTLNSSSFSNGNQSLKNFTLDGDGKKLHGGIYVKNRGNVTIEGIKVQSTNFCGIWVWDVKNSILRNVTIINCSWGSAGWAAGALQLANLESVELVGLNIDENAGYGIKALGSGGNKITKMKVHDSRISVTPAGKWNNGSAPNISFELWDVLLTDCEIYDNYMDNHLSLVNVQTNPTGGRSVRVHHNVFDLKSRAGGHGYGMELTINDAEIDHNWFNGGSYGIAHWAPTICSNWSIHHNTFNGLNSGWPGTVLRAQVSGLHNVRFFNNTVELSGTTTINVIGLHGGKSDNVQIKNNLFIDSNTSYSFWPNPLIFMENGASLSGLQVTHNLFQKMPIGNISGTYANNLTVDPQITRSGARPTPYYAPKNGSPLIDAGTNVGFPFQGSAPDIGAHEIGSTAPPTNQLPTVSLTSPTNNTSLPPGTVTISANAADTNGSVNKVEFFNGATKLGEDTSSPYSYSWTNVPAGTYKLTAKATDNQGGATTSSVVTITISSPNVMPTVNLTSPTNNATFAAGSSITVTANAADANGSVNKVEFFNGATKLGEDTSSPYSYSWTTVPAGTYKLTAKATDNQGGATTSLAITITVSRPNAMPTVNLTAPANNATFTAGSSITLTANAADANGSVNKVEFFNGATKLGEDTASPYNYLWTNVPAGTYKLTAKATDNQAGVTTSRAINIIVNVANTLPAVNITSPANNASFTPGTVTITANATDANGAISKVEFYNGNIKIGEDLTNPYTFAWTNVPAGTYTLTAKAIDNQQGVTTSVPVIIKVAAPNVLPTVALTAPANDASFTAGSDITITATASDHNGSVTKVEFYNGAVKLGEDNTSPYSFVITNAAVGSYLISAKATDNAGAVVTSSVHAVTVESLNTNAKVSLTTPLNNSAFQSGSSINLAATATTTTGSITKVEFYGNDIKIGEDLTSPYTYIWASVPAGNYSVVAKATDNLGKVVSSSPANIEVASANNPPVVKIISPEDNSTMNEGTTISIEAEASDANGSISKVEFFNGTIKLGEDTEAPFVYLWSEVPVGTYSISAKATDNQGSTHTDGIQIFVGRNPIVTVGPDITMSLPENSTQLVGQGESSDGSEVDYNWQQVSGPNNVSIADQDSSSPTISNLTEGTYTFELTVTDSQGLSSKDQITIRVVAGEQLTEGTIPRFFTPNSDGINDMWEWPTSEVYANALVKIFNPSGQKIYEAASYQNNWDGTFDGKPLQPGAYYYVIRLSDSSDIRGAVRIIR